MAGDSGNTLRTQEFNQRSQNIAGQAQMRAGEAVQQGLSDIGQTYLRERQQGIDNQFRQTAMEVEQRQMQVRNEAMMRQLQTDEMEAHSRIQLDQVRKQEAMQKLAIAQQIIALGGTRAEVDLLKAQAERQQLENEEKKRNSAGVGDLRDSTLYASLFLQQEGKRRDKSGRWVNDPDATQESKDLAKSMLGGFGELIGERKEAPSMSRLRDAQATQLEMENARELKAQREADAAEALKKGSVPGVSQSAAPVGFKPIPLEEMRKDTFFRNEAVRYVGRFPQAMPNELRSIAGEQIPVMMNAMVNRYLASPEGQGKSMAQAISRIRSVMDQRDARDLWAAMAETYVDKAKFQQLMNDYDGIK